MTEEAFHPLHSAPLNNPSVISDLEPNISLPYAHEVSSGDMANKGSNYCK